MINSLEVLFENKSKIRDFSFWSELGLSGNVKVLRLSPGQSLVQKVFPDNEWAAFEKIIFKDTTATGGEIRQIIKTTARKGYKQKPINGGVLLDINLNVDINMLGNLPSLMQQYTMEDGEKKLNMMVGLLHKVEVPKNSHCAQHKEMTMSMEVMEVKNDYSPNPVFNIFKLRLVGKREE